VQPALLNLLGYKREEIEGNSARLFHVNDTKFNEYGERVYPEINEKGTCKTEWECKRKDGTILLTENVNSVIKNNMV
jgi:PAS domain S-box-containing protein